MCKEVRLVEWIKNMNSVLNYIEDNLKADIDLVIIEKKAGCSIYNFQRIFSFLTGVSLAEYIRRRRMTKAAFEIQHTNTKIGEIGSQYGYEVAASFNRAFQSVHEVSPIRAREEGIKLNCYPKISFSLSVKGDESMKYRIESRTHMRVIGVRTELVEDAEENEKIVPRFWSETLESAAFKALLEIESIEPKGILGITVYNNPNDIFYYIAVASNSEKPDGLCELVIPEAKWVIFENDGFFPESIQAIYKRFLTEWLPFSGYEWAEKPDIEVYPVSNSKLQKGHSEVWIAIK